MAAACSRLVCARHGVHSAIWWEESPLGRIRFLSTAALVVGPIFLALVLLGGLGAAVHPECRQS